MTGFVVRPLGLDDLPLYRPLRLQALRDHPTAFGRITRKNLPTTCRA